MEQSEKIQNLIIQNQKLQDEVERLKATSLYVENEELKAKLDEYEENEPYSFVRLLDDVSHNQINIKIDNIKRVQHNFILQFEGYPELVAIKGINISESKICVERNYNDKLSIHLIPKGTRLFIVSQPTIEYPKDN